jgi:DNA repair protein RAD5
MSQAQRANCIEQFGKASREPLILLISLKAGGVGLNLYVSCSIFVYADGTAGLWQIVS